MLYLTYVSDFAQELESQDFNNILAVSTEHNARQNITGFLVVVDQHFFQALEGPEEHVLTLLEAIKRDPRHQNLRVIGSETIVKRDFPDWSMGFVCYWKSHLLDDIQSVLLQYAKTEVFKPHHAQGLRVLLQSLG
ncbi:BLUF domain-containing protein [Alteromonadaceae bacterium BrNp21-10]|nr:BLUF domain-containing protein [Alteromonadaceae bacterium BrNp21-10]